MGFRVVTIGKLVGFVVLVQNKGGLWGGGVGSGVVSAGPGAEAGGTERVGGLFAPALGGDNRPAYLSCPAACGTCS